MKCSFNFYMQVDILRAELSAVEKKRRDFEKKCMNELITLKQLLTVQGMFVLDNRFICVSYIYHLCSLILKERDIF